MAKLKIMDAAGNFKVQGYVNVVENLFATGSQQRFDDFLDAEPSERPSLLQAAAGGAANFEITQERNNGQIEAISDANCRIYAQKDEKRRGRRSKVTMPIPDATIGDFLYLENYAQAIHDLFENDRVRCCKFLFGVMAMTRCR